MQRAQTVLSWSVLGIAGWSSWHFALCSQPFRRAFILQGTVVAVALLLLGLAGLCLGRQARGLQVESRTRGLELWLSALAVTLVGVVLRFWQPAHFPRFDEQVVEEVQTGFLAHQGIASTFLDPDFPLTQLLAEASLRFGEATMPGLRVAFVIWSCLAVPIFHSALCRYFGRGPVAFWVTLLFATNTYVVASGRTAMETFAPMTTVVLAWAGMFYAVQRRNHFAFALAGALNGLLFIEYYSFRFVGALNLVWLLLLIAQGASSGPIVEHEARPRLRHVWDEKGKLVFYAAFLIAVALPCWWELRKAGDANLVEGLGRNLFPMLPELQKQTAGQIASGIVERLLGLASALWISTTHALVIPSARGIFDLGTSVLGALATGFLFWRYRRSPVHWWPVLAIASMLVLAACVTFAAARYRVYAAVPFFLLIVGLGLREFRAPRVRCWLATAVVLGLSAWNAWYFLGPTRSDPYVRGEHLDSRLRMVQEMQQALQQSTESPIFFSDYIMDKTGGDYVFLFDAQRVKIVGTVEQVDELLLEAKGARWLLVAKEKIAELERSRFAGSGRFHMLREWERSPGSGDRYQLLEFR